MIVLRINHPLTVGGNIGLVVISRTARELLSSCRPEALPPKRALHGKDDTLRIGHPRHGTGAAGQLRQVHFTVVEAVGQVNLLQHRPPLRGNRENYKHKENQNLPKGEQKSSLPKLENAKRVSKIAETR